MFTPTTTPLRALKGFCITAIAGLSLLSGCVEESAEPNTSPDAAVEQAEGSFEATFVSGHLGSYLGCPDEAANVPASGEQGPPAAGDCAPDEEGGCGGGNFNCSAAMLRLEIVNTGDVALHGFTADPLQIMMDPPLGAEVLAIVDADSGEAIEAIAPGESRQIRVEFRGISPNDGRGGAFNANSEGYPVQLVLDADEADPVPLTTPEVSPLPEIAT